MAPYRSGYQFPADSHEGEVVGEQDVLVVIPARLESRRFPGKPLALAAGMPLLWYTWRTVRAWQRASSVVIATPDDAIYEAASAFGATVQHTSHDCRNGSQRAFEVFLRNPKYDALVNVQVDEPEVTPEMLDAVVGPVLDGRAQIATLAAPFPDGIALESANEVKVVVSTSGRALYFTRQPVPASKRHIGVYAFAGRCVKSLANVQESACGAAEGLEQLDWLDHGYFVNVIGAEAYPLSVNTAEDLEAFRAKLTKAWDVPTHWIEPGSDELPWWN